MWNNRIAAVMAYLALTVVTVQVQAQEPPATADFVVVEGDTLWLVEIVEIVGTRVTAALPGIVRTVGVLDEEDLARLPGRSAAEALQMVPGVVVGQRQQYGVQSDVSIRGSSFEQVQVLLDGFDLGDPQTGHHLMDLPMGRQDIQRLEVLPGHGSTLYGSGAFGGTINVVSRRPALPDTAGHPLWTSSEVAAHGGQNGTWGGRGSAGLALGQKTGVRISGERFRTDGSYVEQDIQNDADTYSTTARLTHQFDRGEADVFAGYADRQFGAPDFYAPYNSFEKTRTFFAAARYNRTVSDRLTLEPRVFFRRHRDEFILFRDNPQSYTNDHQSRKAGAELRGLIKLGTGYALSVSLEGGYEDIDSRGLRSGTWGEALGNHLRRRASLAAELDGHQGRVRWQVGSRVDRRTGFASRVSGSAAVSAEVGRGLIVRTSAGSVYRLPTFTELYYVDPANQGNARLDAERGWTWDLGAEYLTGPWSARITGFTRQEKDLIEWVRTAAADPVEADPWETRNIGEGEVNGVEASFGWRSGPGHALAASYVGLDKTTSLPTGLEGKYGLLVPERQMVLAGTLVLQPGLELTVTGRYLEHDNGPEDFQHSFVLDNRIDWRHPSGWFGSIAGTNLLDRRYEEVPGIPMPGTLYTTTVGWGF